MLAWIIVGPGLPDIKVRARTFDEALTKARFRNPAYCGGYVMED